MKVVGYIKDDLLITYMIYANEALDTLDQTVTNPSHSLAGSSWSYTEL